MKVDWAMLADAAQIRDGLAFVMGGGVDTITSPVLPAVFNGALLVRFVFHPTEAGRVHMLELRINDEDGKELARVDASSDVMPPPDLPVGWDIPSMLALNLSGLQLPRQGRYTIEILGDGNHLRTLNFRVRHAPMIGSPPTRP